MRRTSAGTRASILVAARQRFAADGYAGATIRAIAADAAIDPSMVMRYFGNKQQLFAAAAELDLQLPDLATVPRGALGRTLAAHFLERWETDEALHVLLRTACTNEAAAERMRAIFSSQLTDVVARGPVDRQEAPLRAGLIATQVLGMAFCRYVLQLAPVTEMPREEVVAWLGPTLQRYLVSERMAHHTRESTRRDASSH